MFGTGLNLALVLLLIQSYIYPGATFSTVPAKRYECPSMIILTKSLYTTLTKMEQRNVENTIFTPSKKGQK